MFGEDIIVDDDLVPRDLQDELENIMYHGNSFPWYLCDFRALTSDTESVEHFSKITPNLFEHSQMSHSFVHFGKSNSRLITLPLRIVELICEKYKVKAEVLRIKANLCHQVVCSNPDAHQTPHIDNIEPHWVAIYYVNESDGDTFMFEEKYDYVNDSELSLDNISTVTTYRRISPKKGRLVIFEGSRYHAGMHPRNTDFRIVINFNLKLL